MSFLPYSLVSVGQNSCNARHKVMRFCNGDGTYHISRVPNIILDVPSELQSCFMRPRRFCSRPKSSEWCVLKQEILEIRNNNYIEIHVWAPRTIFCISKAIVQSFIYPAPTCHTESKASEEGVDILSTPLIPFTGCGSRYHVFIKH